MLFLQTILIWSEKDNSLSIVTLYTQQCNNIFRCSMLKCLTLIFICLLSVILIIVYSHPFYKPMSNRGWCKKSKTLLKLVDVPLVTWADRIFSNNFNLIWIIAGRVDNSPPISWFARGCLKIMQSESWVWLGFGRATDFPILPSSSVVNPDKIILKKLFNRSFAFRFWIYIM